MHVVTLFNPYPDDFFKWTCPPFVLDLSIDNFKDIKTKIRSCSDNSKCRTLSDCKEVQAGLALYWWQRLITFSSSKIRVKVIFDLNVLVITDIDLCHMETIPTWSH